MRELIFLTLANHLPRIKILDYGRAFLYKLAGVKISGFVGIYGPLIIRPIGAAKNISIGDRSGLNTYIRFGCPKDPITIGRNCMIGANVSFETVGHDLIRNTETARGTDTHRAFKFTDNVLIGGRGTYTRPITVEDDVWIGTGAIILPGVTIGKGAVVAAGAVVTKNVPPMTVVFGNPAKVFRKLE